MNENALKEVDGGREDCFRKRNCHMGRPRNENELAKLENLQWFNVTEACIVKRDKMSLGSL